MEGVGLVTRGDRPVIVTWHLLQLHAWRVICLGESGGFRQQWGVYPAGEVVVYIVLVVWPSHM